MLNAIVSPRTRGPWRGGAAATHIEHCVRSLYSPSGAASLATLAAPHSAMSVGAAWNRVTTSVWWLCGNPALEDTRRCTQKAVSGRRKSSVILGGYGVVPRIERSEPYSTYKVVHIQGTQVHARKRRFVATAGLFLFRGGAGVSPALSVASRSPHTRRCTYMFNAIVSTRTRGPWRRGAPCLRADDCI